MSGEKAGGMGGGNSIRMGICEALGVSDRPLCVAELAELFNLRFSQMNYHLRVLLRASEIQVAHSEQVGSSIRTFYEKPPVR